MHFQQCHPNKFLLDEGAAGGGILILLIASTVVGYIMLRYYCMLLLLLLLLLGPGCAAMQSFMFQNEYLVPVQYRHLGQ